MSKSKPESNNNITTKPPAGSGKRVKPVAEQASADASAGPSTPTPPAKKPRKAKVETLAPEIKELLTVSIEEPTEKEMEVHHHPQLNHKHKPWKEYLLEGFMIFIAVMMGFIAENIRETITNSEHVRQLTSRLVQDLKVDAALLDTAYTGESEILKSNDSLFAILQQPLAKVDTRKMQRLIFNSHSLWQFHPSAVAIAAIKNELYLKQFSDSEIISYISTYEKHIELERTAQDITLTYQRSYLDPFMQTYFTPANLSAVFNRKMPTTEMRNITQQDLTALANNMVLIRVNTNELMRDNKFLKNDVVQLMNYVTERYQ